MEMVVEQGQSKKRKNGCGYAYDDNEDGMVVVGFSWEDQLNQDLLEKILSWLPTSTFYSLRSVCKRWNSVAESASFRLACAQVPFRDPCFFMVDSHHDQSIVFDTSRSNWKHINNTHPRYHRVQQQSDLTDCGSSSSCCNDLIPVTASGGLVCFRSTGSGAFLVANPVTGASRELPPMPTNAQNQNIHAIAMNSSSKHSYRLVLVSGELPNLSVRVYESGKDCWEEEVKLKSQKAEGKQAEGEEEDDSTDAVGGDEVLYFLSKTGEVMATNMQRSPSKQYSSVIAVKDGQEIIYFLSSSGTVVACNLVMKTFFEYPRMLPVCYEYSIDVVECRGEMLVVVLSEFLETASLRVWRFSEDRSWRQIAVMPPYMSHELYGKKADINCVGSGDDKLMICVNSSKVSRYVMCDLGTNDWTELPKCVVDGKPKEFMSAFSFEPRIEACV